MKYLKYIIFNLSFLIFNSFCFSQNASGESSRTIDSLKLALKSAKHDTTRCNILAILAETASDDEWPAFNEQLNALSQKNLIHNSEEKNLYLKHFANALNNNGYLAMDEGDMPKALDYFHKSLKIQEKIRNREGIATSVNNIGSIYESQGDISKALEYFHKSLKIREEIGDKSGISTSLNNIGFIYQNQGDISKAFNYYNRSLIICEKIGDKSSVSTSLNNLGTIYQKQGNNPKALEYYNKSLKNYEEIGDKSGIAYSLNNIGSIYANQSDVHKALDYYQKSLKIQEDINDQEGIAYSLNNISLFLIKNGKTNEGLMFANRSMQIAKELGFPENIKNSARTIKTIYQKQKKYKDAFEMYELEIKMRDSINNQETQKAAIKKQMQYTFEKKELETKAEQDKKDVIAKAELKQKENERNYFIVGFGLVAVLALFILRGYKQKQKANEVIAAQKHLVEDKQKEILDSINYAKRIQMALLPSEKYIERNLNQLNKKKN